MEALPFDPDDVDAFIGEPYASTIEAVEENAEDTLILGAAGKMGLHLAIALREALARSGRKNRIFAVSRFGTLRGRSDFEERGIETIQCDLTDRDAVGSLPDCPNVFFLAGVKFGTSTDSAALQKINVEMPRLVSERFRKSRVVALSTGCVYPFVAASSGGSTELSGLGSVGDYAESCRGREDAFFGASRDYGLRCAIIRLNYSVEFRYGVFVDIGLKVLNGESVDVTTGHFNAIWQGDAVNYVIQSLNFASSPPFVINVTGPDTLAVRLVARKFGEIFGKQPIFTGEEAQTAWLNNAAKARQLMGPTKIGVDEIINWTAEWLRQGGNTWGKPTLFERRSGNF